ncbi:MAG: N-6 DNA methylase [Sedimentisphaerales bacterium]|nr:N-6 DNA methylase [Sedimentisphaerales bacterium]
MMMGTQDLLEQLGYTQSSNYLQGSQLTNHPAYAHIFRQAQNADCCKLHGAYVIQRDNDTPTPVVYVCEAQNEEQARKIHRFVWNQNIAPFVLIITPQQFRIYSGFDYSKEERQNTPICEILTNANDILAVFEDFAASSIDSGKLWRNQSHQIRIENRVDRRLLKSLKQLSDELIQRFPDIERHNAHTLIGKYVYLSYLREREILSNVKLAKFQIQQEQIFGRNAQKTALYKLERALNDWLNGSVFPLPPSGIRTDHIRLVASTFCGDDPASGQMHLDFSPYDFSHIPIETLSVVYQQFLHAEKKGRDKGAYYTPSFLVNFMLDELEDKKPLKDGMRVFDPSCGSGAFLVQCYRRLIEKEIHHLNTKKISLIRLRELLTKNIFGLEVDEDACNVAELSLLMTLLDYAEPPDLSSIPQFKLPALRDRNIFHCEQGFFDLHSEWEKNRPQEGYDWIVGNPPWKQLKKNKLEGESDRCAIDWIKDCEKPIDNYQIAEAFAWKVTECIHEKGQVALLLPALTLFTKQGKGFRKEFFSAVHTWCIVNFANLRHCLFEGAVNPAATFFFSGKKDWSKPNHYITTYSPFAIEQPSQSSTPRQKSRKLWSIYVNHSMVKEIPLRDIADGSSLTWKIAMWGTHRDKILLRKLKNIPGLDSFVKQRELNIGQGLEIRYLSDTKEKIELVNEIRNKKQLIMSRLKSVKSLHSFPDEVFDKLPKDEDIYVREGRKEKPLQICQPPHVFIDESRRFAIYSDEFFIVPPRQIGISGNETKEKVLKALAAYLKSDFAHYQQWFTSAASGIERDVTTLKDLKHLPVPLASMKEHEITEWASLHDAIVEADCASRSKQKKQNAPLFEQETPPGSSLKCLLEKMNTKVYETLKITCEQRWMIEDMLNVRFKLNEGKIAQEAIDPPEHREIFKYAQILKDKLDDFLDETRQLDYHRIHIYYAEQFAILKIENIEAGTAGQPQIVKVDQQTKKEFNKLQKKLRNEDRQWIYFDKGFRFFEGRITYFFKPMQRLYWLKSQAIVDADELIGEKLAAYGGR